MMHLFAHLQNGSFLSTSAIDEAALAQVQSGWLDLENPSEEELSFLQKTYRFHPLAIEDCRHKNQRPKLDEYPDNLFLVLHGVTGTKESCLDIYEIQIFFTKHVVVTVRDVTIAPLVRLVEKARKSSETIPKQVDFLLHTILDVVMDENPAELEAIESQIEDLDVKVLGETDSQYIERLFLLQQRVGFVRRMIAPQRDIFEKLEHPGTLFMSGHASFYLRDVHDHLIRLLGRLEDIRESIANIRESYVTLAAYRRSESMRRLTLFSVIFLPLTFITGFFGMNFTALPWSNHYLLAAVFVLVLCLPIIMGVLFVRSKRF